MASSRSPQGPADAEVRGAGAGAGGAPQGHLLAPRPPLEDVSGEAHVLPAGAEQDNLGGPRALPAPVPGGLRRLWLRVVSVPGPGALVGWVALHAPEPGRACQGKGGLQRPLCPSQNSTAGILPRKPCLWLFESTTKSQAFDLAVRCPAHLGLPEPLPVLTQKVLPAKNPLSPKLAGTVGHSTWRPDSKCIPFPSHFGIPA